MELTSSKLGKEYDKAVYHHPAHLTYMQSVHVSKSLESCPTLRNTRDYSLPVSSVHGILQARTLEGVAMPSSRGPSQPTDHICVSCDSCIAGSFLATEPVGKLYMQSEAKWKSLSHAQLFVTPWTVYGIPQARIMEWVAFPFSRGFSQPRDQTQVSHIAGEFFTSWATREAQEHGSG